MIKPNKVIILKKTKIYNGKIIKLNKYKIAIDNKLVEHEIIEHRGSVAILAFDGDDVIVIRQYRFPSGYIFEIPAGTIEKDESEVECALREIIEETGYMAKNMTHLITYYPTKGTAQK